MSGGVIRRYHLLVLRLVAAGSVHRAPDYEYRCPGRTRQLTEAVYLLESRNMVKLYDDGTVEMTDTGVAYLARRATSSGAAPVNA